MIHKWQKTVNVCISNSFFLLSFIHLMRSFFYCIKSIWQCTFGCFFSLFQIASTFEWKKLYSFVSLNVFTSYQWWYNSRLNGFNGFKTGNSQRKALAHVSRFDLHMNQLHWYCAIARDTDGKRIWGERTTALNAQITKIKSHLKRIRA